MGKKTKSGMTSGLAVCVTEIEKLSPEIQLFPDGNFRSRDGRPYDSSEWRMDATIAALLVKLADERKTPYVIDYEHQTLNSEWNGHPAPAAGWFSRLEWRDGDGLYAIDVEWTDRAKEMIKAGEYRFISPVFSYDTATGVITSLHSVALTNAPAIDGMSDVLMRAAARFKLNQPEDTPPMKALLKALGIAEDADEATALAALKAVQDKADAAETEVVALKQQQPDPARFVPVEVVKTMQTELAALKAKDTERDVQDLISPALADGRILPAQEVWARALGNKDLAALKSFIDTAQPVASLKGMQSGGKAPDGSASGETLTAEERAVCKALGMGSKEFLETKQARAAT